MSAADHSDVGFVPSSGADHSDVGFVPAKADEDPLWSVGGMRAFVAKKMFDPRTYTQALPVVGGMLGAIPGAAAGAAVGLPTGPGAIASGAIGAGAGAAMGAAAGRGLQHVAETALGYEKPIGDASDLEDRLADMGKEGAINGGVTAALGLAPAAAKAVAPKLYDAGINAGRRFLTYGSGTLKSTEPLAGEAVKEAFDQGAIKPGMSVSGASDVLEQARVRIGDVYGRILKALKARGIEGPEAEDLAQRLATEGRSVASSNTNPAVRSVYDQEAAALRATETPGGTDFTVAQTPSGNLEVDQAEGLKQSLQARAKYGGFTETPVNEARRDAASIYRQANEDAIDQGVAASGDPVTQAIGDQFQPVKQQFGRVTAADDVATQGAASAARRRVASPSDMMMTAAGVASGDVTQGATLGIVNHLARTRGTSTAAWAALSASEKLQTLARVNPASLGRYGPILAKALSEGAQSFAANTYALSQTDPQFQALQREMNEGK